MFKNTQGVFKILPLLDCITLGNKINFYRNVLRFIYFMYVGSIMQLKFYRLFFLISNIGLTIPKFSTAQGTYSFIVKKKNNLVLIKLPSKQLI
jgi:ribosomal protein L2